eukprot:COSAG01_NODE_8596_length_2724_cov_1.993524_2_plen_134_part_00
MVYTHRDNQAHRDRSAHVPCLAAHPSGGLHRSPLQAAAAASAAAAREDAIECECEGLRAQLRTVCAVALAMHALHVPPACSSRGLRGVQLCAGTLRTVLARRTWGSCASCGRSARRTNSSCKAVRRPRGSWVH